MIRTTEPNVLAFNINNRGASLTARDLAESKHYTNYSGTVQDTLISSLSTIIDNCSSYKHNGTNVATWKTTFIVVGEEDVRTNVALFCLSFHLIPQMM